MKQMTFAEINDLENGQQVPAFTGRIKKVFDQKSDVGQYGQWWLQNLILQDDHANEITMTWCCEDAWSDKDEGTILNIESGRGKKDELVGVKKEIRNKNGKKYESVKVDDRAKIKRESSQQGRVPRDLEDADSHGQHGEVDGPPLDWPEAPENAPQAPPARQNVDSGVQEARKHLMQSANLYVLCVKCVNNVIAAELPEIARTSEMFQAATGTLFIEASRAGYVQKMPEKPITNGGNPHELS